MRNFCVSLIIMALGAPCWAHDSNCENLLAHLQTSSFQDTLRGANDIRGVITRYLESRAPEEKAEMDRHLTARHASREMSFQVKNEKTGNYDQFVAVKVNSAVAPMLKSDFDRLVQSTGPLMRLYRSLLQKIYSSPNPGAADLGFQSLPPSEAELAIKIIRNSMYYEPAFVHPNMKDYPFLTVGGFDGAVVDPRNPTPEFFETNMGTPSGVSNNGQLLEDFLWTDDKLRELTEGHRPTDETFAILRSDVESNAKAWTQRDGIAVVMSPGIYNGAHPDVAAIARGTGLPLVNGSDLYLDARGFLRMNTGRKAVDPVVTCILSRREESYVTQNNADGIPMISPNFETNHEIGQRLGMSLRSGAIYDFIYANDGRVRGVRKDKNGQPKLMEVWDSLGADPARPDAPRGSLAQAIIHRKVYLSNLGGRVIDDKRLFRILTEYLLPQDQDLARPIRGLSPDNYRPYYANPSLFVVKEPDKSGGSGIFFPRAMPENEVKQLTRRVRANPGDFKIEYVSSIATLKDASSEVPIDVRIFVSMDAEGQVHAGVNSLLLRTGADGGLYTNTSRGGGYGIGFVVHDQPQQETQARSIQPNLDLPVARVEQFLRVLEGSKALLECVDTLNRDSAAEKWSDCRGQALELSFAYRDIMDLINPWHMDAVESLRFFAHGAHQELEFSATLSRTLRQSLNKMDLVENPSLRRAYQRFAAVHPKTLKSLDAVDVQYRKLPGKAKLRRLSQPEVSYVFDEENKIRSRKLEVAEYLSVENPEIQAVIDEVKAFGGQVRLLVREDLEKTPVGVRQKLSREPAYFWINLNPKSPSYLLPVIGIDLSSQMALAGLYHEREHFRLTRELYQNLRAQGLPHEQALVSAYLSTDSDEAIIEGERRAVAAELDAEVNFEKHPFNKVYGERDAIHYWEPGYANRVLYPEFEGLRRHLKERKEKGEPVDREFVLKHFGAAISRGLDIRDRAIEYWSGKSDSQAKVAALRKSNVFSMFTEPYGADRLTIGSIREDFKAWLSQVCEEMGVSEQDCGVPRFKKAN